ncbi:MAG: oligopeptide/dipeptide ABC transporter ATP-binding protein [Candidatus Limivivens sp.]|nr:oligopeptide/dipeptide ABC transporter ATP-binding protein [Candidatus Limivivens sp.]
MEEKHEVILQAQDLKKYFTVRSFLGTSKRFIKAVDGVNLEIRKGEAFGLVGESGCGKSTLGRTLIRMYEPTDGQIFFDGVDITHKKKKEILPYHKRMQIIFQDPYSALDPHQNVREILEEPLRMNTDLSSRERGDYIVELLGKVGLGADALEKYAYEFSGGQRQRIGIARALSVNPDFIMCDEPISALDVSIQAQVVNMLEDLQQEFGLTYLFVSHDLSMVRHISNRIGVMYLGNLVEIADNDELYENPLHPYTKALLSAIPIADPRTARNSKRQIIQGDLPSPLNIPTGCRFHTRCPHATERCRQEAPVLKAAGRAHQVACHLV